MAIDKSRCNNPLFGTERSRIIEDSSVLGLGEDLTVTIADYLDEVAQESEQLVLDVATLAKNAMVLDIVDKSAHTSCCFTKNYGRYMKGTGSVLANCTRDEIEAAYSAPDHQRTARIHGEFTVRVIVTSNRPLVVISKLSEFSSSSRFATKAHDINFLIMNLMAR